jgi:predicted PurR-regulated permease PerM
MEKYQLEISYQSILRVVFVLLIAVFLFMIQKILLALFAAFVVSAITNPLVDWFEKKKISRTLTTTLVYIAIFIFIGLVFYWIIPSLAVEIKDLALRFPRYIAENVAKYPFLEQYNIKENITKFTISTADIIKEQSFDIFLSTVSFLSNLFYIFFALAVAFYLTAEKSLIKTYLEKIVREENHRDLIKILDEIEFKMGRWFLSQVALSFISGVAIFIGLTLLGVPFALPLAVLAAILRFIPYLGGLISDSAGILIAFLSSPALGVAAFLMYYIIQQIEGYIFIPMVMRQTVGLNPAVVIIAVVVGGQLGGITGALLAIPITIVLGILFKRLVLKEGNG